MKLSNFAFLPPMDDIKNELIQRMKKDFPDLNIIGISGGGRTRNMDFLQLAKQFGAKKILSKPFTEDELLENVNACL